MLRRSRTDSSQDIFRDPVSDHYGPVGWMRWPGCILVAGEENVSAGFRVTYTPGFLSGRFLR